MHRWAPGQLLRRYEYPTIKIYADLLFLTALHCYNTLPFYPLAPIVHISRACLSPLLSLCSTEALKRKLTSLPQRHGGSGIGKSPSPAPSSLNGRWTHDLHHKNNPMASRVTKKSTPLPSSITPSIAASLSNNRLFTALHGTIAPAPTPTAPKNGVHAGLTIRGASRQAPGFSIKGAAGPFVVRASNLAPGTTAEDVKTAMLPLGKIISCIILTATPTVMAEIVFEKKDAVERCIEQYNNQIADGQLAPSRK